VEAAVKANYALTVQATRSARLTVSLDRPVGL
jgi:hypothetical protein